MGLTPDHALNLSLLDHYVKDVFKSFFGFWLLIGPTIYKAYFSKEDDPFKYQLPEDRYASMVKRAFDNNP